jgi:hypothetical protein
MSKKINRDLKAITEELHAALKREKNDFIAIGVLLIEAREELEYGEWLPWLAENFGSSTSTAENYMNAARFAVKFPTVRNLKLRPSALYALSGFDSDYEGKVIAAALSEAETKWVNRDRVEEIWESIFKSERDERQRRENEDKENQEETENAETAADTEADDILDGPPPDLPPTPKPVVHDVILPSFDQALKSLASLQTKRLEDFSGTEYKADDLHAIADFLHAVADAIERQQKSTHDQNK